MVMTNKHHSSELPGVSNRSPKPFGNLSMLNFSPRKSTTNDLKFEGILETKDKKDNKSKFYE